MKPISRKKERLSNIFLVLVLLTGLSLLLYPTVSNYWNTLHQTRAIAQYTAQVEEMDEADREELLTDAHWYNQTLTWKHVQFVMDDEEREAYERLLRVSDSDIIAYVEIPKTKCKQPVYHGTAEGTLQTAIGHLEGTSLPVGGKSTHCVLTGHRGLPSARLFTDLDQMKEGDIFFIHVLGKTLTYEVDQILVVLPEETEELEIVKGKDYCTLMTCTPYGVNSHRLLVRGHRIPNPAPEADDSSQMQLSLLLPVLAAAALILLLAFLTRSRNKKWKKK